MTTWFARVCLSACLALPFSIHATQTEGNITGGNNNLVTWQDITSQSLITFDIAASDSSDDYTIQNFGVIIGHTNGQSAYFTNPRAEVRFAQGTDHTTATTRVIHHGVLDKEQPTPFPVPFTSKEMVSLWIAYNDGHIVAGHGTPGENIMVNVQSDHLKLQSNDSKILSFRAYGGNMMRVSNVKVEELSDDLLASTIRLASGVNNQRCTFTAHAPDGFKVLLSGQPLNIATSNNPPAQQYWIELEKQKLGNYRVSVGTDTTILANNVMNTLINLPQAIQIQPSYDGSTPPVISEVSVVEMSTPTRQVMVPEQAAAWLSEHTFAQSDNGMVTGTLSFESGSTAVIQLSSASKAGENQALYNAVITADGTCSLERIDGTSSTTVASTATGHTMSDEQPFWLSYYNGAVMIGFDQSAGLTPLFFAVDDAPHIGVSRVGFACRDAKVTYDQIAMASTLLSATFAGTTKDNYGDIRKKIFIPFAQENKGVITFDASATSDYRYLTLYDKSGANQVMYCRTDRPDGSHTLIGAKQLPHSNQSYRHTHQANNGTRYWLAYDSGAIAIGHGSNPGQNITLAYRWTPATAVRFFSFSCYLKEATISNLNSAPLGSVQVNSIVDAFSPPVGQHQSDETTWTSRAAHWGIDYQEGSTNWKHVWNAPESNFEFAFDIDDNNDDYASVVLSNTAQGIPTHSVRLHSGQATINSFSPTGTITQLAKVTREATPLNGSYRLKYTDGLLQLSKKGTPDDTMIIEHQVDEPLSALTFTSYNATKTYKNPTFVVAPVEEIIDETTEDVVAEQTEPEEQASTEQTTETEATEEQPAPETEEAKSTTEQEQSTDETVETEATTESEEAPTEETTETETEGSEQATASTEATEGTQLLSQSHAPGDLVCREFGNTNLPAAYKRMNMPLLNLDNGFMLKTDIEVGQGSGDLFIGLGSLNITRKKDGVLTLGDAQGLPDAAYHLRLSIKPSSTTINVYQTDTTGTPFSRPLAQPATVEHAYRTGTHTLWLIVRQVSHGGRPLLALGIGTEPNSTPLWSWPTDLSETRYHGDDVLGSSFADQVKLDEYIPDGKIAQFGFAAWQTNAAFINPQVTGIPAAPDGSTESNSPTETTPTQTVEELTPALDTYEWNTPAFATQLDERGGGIITTQATFSMSSQLSIGLRSSDEQEGPEYRILLSPAPSGSSVSLYQGATRSWGNPVNMAALSSLSPSVTSTTATGTVWAMIKPNGSTYTFYVGLKPEGAGDDWRPAIEDAIWSAQAANVSAPLTQIAISRHRGEVSLSSTTILPTPLTDFEREQQAKAAQRAERNTLQDEIDLPVAAQWGTTATRKEISAQGSTYTFTASGSNNDKVVLAFSRAQSGEPTLFTVVVDGFGLRILNSQNEVENNMQGSDMALSDTAKKYVLKVEPGQLSLGYFDDASNPVILLNWSDSVLDDKQKWHFTYGHTAGATLTQLNGDNEQSNDNDDTSENKVIRA